MLAGALAATLLIAILLSLVPLLAPWRGRLGGSIQRGGRGGTREEASRRVRFSLVAVETGASLALLVGSALMIRTVMNLVRTDLGFQTANIVRGSAGPDLS